MLVYNFQGPNNLPGRLFVATVGTAVAFSAGLAIANTGLTLYNPATAGPVNGSSTQGTKVIVLRAGFNPTGTGTTEAWGFVKTISTATLGALSAFSGNIFLAGAAAGTGSGCLQLAGTSSWLNGTANTTQMWVTQPQSILGTLGGQSTTIVDFHGELTLMPNEGCVLVPVGAVTAQATVVWAELPFSSGA
jgi:hypothetical protein